VEKLTCELRHRKKFQRELGLINGGRDGGGERFNGGCEQFPQTLGEGRRRGEIKEVRHHAKKRVFSKRCVVCTVVLLLDGEGRIVAPWGK